MIRVFALVLLSAVSAPPGVPLLASCLDLKVRLSPPDPIQGAIVLVEVEGARGEITATWKDRPLPLWRAGPKGPLRALVGIDLEQPPGEAALLVSRENAEPCRIDLAVRPGDFPERQLTVARRYVRPSPRDLARAAREAARLEAIFATPSPERQWQGPFRLPLDVEPSSSFGQRRILNGERQSVHAGTDFGAPLGTRVRATQSGRVVLASSLFWSGGTVVVDHGLGLFSFYGHLSATSVRQGQRVKKGTVLGRVGATGRATGPHLHWSIRLGGARVNPLDLVALPGPGSF